MTMNKNMNDDSNCCAPFGVYRVRRVVRTAKKTTPATMRAPATLRETTRTVVARRWPGWPVTVITTLPEKSMVLAGDSVLD